MSDLNVVAIVGRLVRNAELKTTAGGAPVLTCSIANNYYRKDGGGVSYIDITYFGPPALAVTPYLLKGKEIVVNGEIRQDRWQTPEGKSNSKVYILARGIQLLGGKQADPPQTQAELLASEDDIPF